MTRQSEDFEQQIHRVYELLENSGAIVTWNARIPDPDNLSSLRQIDITIRNGDLLTLIECRLRNKKQDVQWVEELMGRKVSLNAHAVIGVSSSGFTKGAMSKGLAKGVILRDLKALSDSEIASWGGYISISLYYYQFKHFKLTLFVDDKHLDAFKMLNPYNELLKLDVFQNIFNYVLELLEKDKFLSRKIELPDSVQALDFKVKLDIGQLKIQDIPIKHIIIEGNCELVEKRQLFPQIYSFGDPGFSKLDRDVYIQQFESGETEIIHTLDKVAITIDLSKLNLPELAMFTYANQKSSKEVYIESFSLINPESMRIKVPIFNVGVESISNLPEMNADYSLNE